MKILVVDDHGYNRELLGFILEDYGHEAIFAENGKIACDSVNENLDVDLVLMDVMMPVMDGLEATRTIKAGLSGRFLPVLFVTALDDEKNVTACLEAGGDDFVPKPVNENILVAKLNAHVRSKKLYDTLKNVNEELTFHRGLVDREHNIVEHIFKNGSDRVATRCDNIESYSSPMSMFNGDLVLVAPSPSGGVYGVVGDFTGHGLAASIGSLPVTEVFFHNVQKQASVAQIAQDINQRLKLLLPSNMFFCAAIFELDRMGDSMTLWMGGMNDIYAVPVDGGDLVTVTSQHMPLGILSDVEFDDSPEVIALSVYSQIFVYTDGITEAHNDASEEFGELRLADIIRQRPDSPIQTILNEVNAFTSLSEQTDDVSIMLIKPKPVVHRSKETNEVVDVAEAYHLVDSIPWTLDMELTGEDLRSTSVVNQVMSFVSSIKGIELHQDKIFTIVSELYNNALEHGVLRLDSALKQDADGFQKYYELREQRLSDLVGQTIAIGFRYFKGSPNYLILTIEDSGDGFSPDRYLAACKNTEEETEEEENFSHGRGIQLLHHLCASLIYENEGKRVVAKYELCAH